MDPEQALLLEKKRSKCYFFSNLKGNLIILLFISIITTGIYICLSCEASQLIQVFASTSASTKEHDGEGYSDGLDWEEEDQMVMDNEFYTRQYNLRQKCQELNVHHESNFRELIINRERGLIYCNVFGAASSTWLYYFNLLAKYEEDYLDSHKTSDALLSLARKKYPPVSSEELKNISRYSVSFIIVRHPYERLASVYNEKFMFDMNSVWVREIGDQIIFTTRIKSEVVTDEFGKISEFQYPPTFEEFVRFILCQWRANKTVNEHWAPVTEFCTPCQVDFDLILKFETLEDEQAYLIERSNLKRTIERVTKKPIIHEEIEDLSEQFFSQLSKKQILELYEYFKEDFELFGYSAEKYFDLGQEIHTSLPCSKFPDD